MSRAQRRAGIKASKARYKQERAALQVLARIARDADAALARGDVRTFNAERRHYDRWAQDNGLGWRAR